MDGQSSEILDKPIFISYYNIKVLGMFAVSMITSYIKFHKMMKEFCYWSPTFSY